MDIVFQMHVKRTGMMHFDKTGLSTQQALEIHSSAEYSHINCPVTCLSNPKPLHVECDFGQSYLAETDRILRLSSRCYFPNWEYGSGDRW